MWPDPLKVLDDLLASATQPAGHKITWFFQTGASGAEVEQFLRSYGIRCWGRTYEEEEGEATWYGITVRKSQAKWAATLMLTKNIPIRTGGDGAKAMAGLPRTSWDSTAPAVGLGGMVSQMFTGAPRAKNTRRRKLRRRRARR